MASNNIHTLSTVQLINLAAQIKTGVGSGTTNPYGLAPASVDAMAATGTALAAANVSMIAAKAAYRSAVDLRDAKRLACASAVSGIANQVYSNRSVTPEMISALGLSPRSTARTRHQPKTPIELTATPQPDGGALLKWAANGNVRGTTYSVEARTEGGEWRLCSNTCRCRLSVGGLTPGAPVSFRVIASKNEALSEPSAPTTVYAPLATPALRLAA